jgi:hypothetical protein
VSLTAAQCQPAHNRLRIAVNDGAPDDLHPPQGRTRHQNHGRFIHDEVLLCECVFEGRSVHARSCAQWWKLRAGV